MLTEIQFHFVHVMMDTMKMMTLFVKNVDTDVLLVLPQLISVPNVME